MREFLYRLTRALKNLIQRFLTNQPETAYEVLFFRAIREAATIYSRRIVIL